MSIDTNFPRTIKLARLLGQSIAKLKQGDYDETNGIKLNALIWGELYKELTQLLNAAGVESSMDVA